MANASYIQDAFTGGEKSQLAQGRINDREYRTWLNVCVNGHPTEAGGWVRRAGTMYAGHTRKGSAARVIKFDFVAATPYTMEFTDNFIRFRQGLRLATTNDTQSVISISNLNPAVVQTAAASGWSTGNTVFFTGAQPLTYNRQFTITVVDSTHFSLQDALTGATIDGSLLGSLPGGAKVSRIQELASPYAGGNWANVRTVQAEKTALILQGSILPQLLTVTTSPSAGVDAQFSLGALTFLDGPYLDPFTTGVQVTPSAVEGIITLTLSFQAFDGGKAYNTGDFATSAAVNYISLVDNNVGNTPASSPADWSPVSAGAAINNGQGFVGTDLQRLVRLFSEPPIWQAITTYAAGNVVSYNPTGQPGAATYWTSLQAGNIGNIPGSDVTHWGLASNVAGWSWGKIVAFVNQISQSLAGSVPIGNMLNIANAFDGIIDQSANNSAEVINEFSGFPGSDISGTVDCYVGKNFTGAGAQKISSVTIYPSNDASFNLLFFNTGGLSVISQSMTMVLRANTHSPLSPSDGTILGIVNNPTPFQAVSIASSDQNTAWDFVWVEFIFGALIASDPSVPGPSFNMIVAAAEVQFFSPPGAAVGNAIQIALLGSPLLYTSPIITWRLGAYSNTTGWPTVGAYHQGRVWLAGAIDNRFDASVSNGLVGDTLNMAPTAHDGTVGAANGIAGILNSDGVNPIFWMMPDLQGIIAGTQAGEWLISAPSPGAISPTNIDANRVTKIGCSFVEPRKTDHTTVFAQRYTKKVMEYFTDVYSGKFAAPNLAKDVMHITKPTIAELAYTQANIPVIWGRNNDGSWWGATYKRDTLATSTGPTINGWHRHSLGSGRSVQSIAAGPSVDGALDALTMVTFDASSLIYHVEIMTDAVDEGDTLVDATYLDDAINPTSTTTSNSVPAPFGGLTLTGLWHLNGKTVTAWLGGLDCGDFTVVNGSITVPYGDGISVGTATGLFTATFAAGLTLSEMLVGFTFTSQGQIVRPATPQESGARNGPAVGKVRRNHKIAAQFEGTGVGVSVGTIFTKVDPVKFRQPNDTAFAVNQQFTGVYKDTLTDTFSFDGMVCWQITRPYPCNLANIGGMIETSDE